MDEGKQFFVRRIDFTGNTTTRDKVIRREMLIDEGDMFNSHLWELSILRLNQLGIFRAAEGRRSGRHQARYQDQHRRHHPEGEGARQELDSVERRRLRDIAGTFIGVSYSTNNFLGLGETLSLSSQLGTLQRTVQFGFTEPYLFDRPIQSGFTALPHPFQLQPGPRGVHSERAESHSVIYRPRRAKPAQLRFQRIRIHYLHVDVSAEAQFRAGGPGLWLRHIEYQDLDQTPRQLISTTSTSRESAGPTRYTGIRTSKITPSYSYNTVNHPIDPDGRQVLLRELAFAGNTLGGNVNTIQPHDRHEVFPHGLKNRHVIGVHFLGKVLTGYGGKVAPPFTRFYIGGENDIRGFDFFSVSPVAFIPDAEQTPVYNDNGTQRVQRTVNADGSISFNPVEQTIPTYRLVLPGGDTVGVFNFEYRIKVFGPVNVVPFFDAGLDKLSFANQLRINAGRLEQLNGEFPQAGYGAEAYIAPGTQILRTSTGLEIQVLMPVVNAPFRVYFAYNPTRVNTTLQPPLAIDRSMFNNDYTYNAAVALYGTAIPYSERSTTFRFTIGRTF